MKVPPHVCVLNPPALNSNIVQNLRKGNVFIRNKEFTTFILPVGFNNHWTFHVVDRQARQVLSFNSINSYGGVDGLIKELIGSDVLGTDDYKIIHVKS